MAKNRPERQISIRSIRRDPPDYQKLGRAFLALAMAQAEAEAQAQAQDSKTKKAAENTKDTGPEDES
jgi:hypothetical protein